MRARGYAYLSAAVLTAVLGTLVLVLATVAGQWRSQASSDLDRTRARIAAHTAVTAALNSSGDVAVLRDGAEARGGRLEPCRPEGVCVRVTSLGPSRLVLAVPVRPGGDPVLVSAPAPRRAQLLPLAAFEVVD